MLYLFTVRFFLTVALISTPSHLARILGLFPINSKSHHSINQPIVKGLASRGHNVVIISPFKSADAETLENYTELVISDKNLVSFVDSVNLSDLKMITNDLITFHILMSVDKNGCREILNQEYIKNITNSSVKMVDVLIVEAYHTQCFNILAKKLDIPVILILPLMTMLGQDIMTGNPSNPSHVPLVMTSYTTNMNFFQRIYNFMLYVAHYTAYYSYYNHYTKEMAKEYLNAQFLNYEELHQRVAIQLVNNHYTLMSRPTTPNVINIAGIHVKHPKALPQDIKKFVTEAERGVIYFSFGTAVKASSMPKEIINMFLKVFSKIPQRVLWKIDEFHLPDVPANVKVSKWFPQRDILEYSNVRAFISQCGLCSTIEAIHTGTPIIAIPLVFDQNQVAKILVEKGVAIYLDYSSLTEFKLLHAIEEIFNNSMYHDKIKTLSAQFRDRIINPIDEALFWVEYVIRHNGAPMLRTTAADMPFYQYLLMDVTAALLVFFCVILWISKIFLLNLWKFLSNYFCCEQGI